MKAIRKRSVALLTAAVLVLGMLAGCGFGAEDAKAYVQAVLDASYKAEFEEYAELTDSTKEEAQQLYDENIETIVGMLELEELGVTEEMMEQYQGLFQEVLAKAKYTVGEARKTDDGFEVDVQAEPMRFKFSDEMQEEILARCEEEFLNSGEEISEEKIIQLVMDMTYELLGEMLAEIPYGEPQTVTVPVTQNDDGLWEVPESDLQAIDEALFMTE